jgi:hypothetical protein
MTDFFADLEHELRRAHRRDTTERRPLIRPRVAPGILRAVVAAALVVVVLAAVAALTQESDIERSAGPPPTPTPAGPSNCAPYVAPTVDEPIPKQITRTMAIFRDPAGELPRNVRSFGQSAKLYEGAVELRLADAPGLRAFAIAAEIMPFSAMGPDYDMCAPPPGPTELGVCLYATVPEREIRAARCFTVPEIAAGDAWMELTRRMVVGVAPDAVRSVVFGSGRTDALPITRNAFAGEVAAASWPRDADVLEPERLRGLVHTTFGF